MSRESEKEDIRTGLDEESEGNRKRKRKGAEIVVMYFLNGPSLASFSFIFGLFKQTIQILQQINVKNVHSVYGAGI